ncbi:hypothetical protein ABIA33_006353 [Streptacidiphilus sp. MAP12-16]|uniref:hypothetical protein n=1 Tax=Streptacidiphilus sp. MAP12-16 TaxID=3156300 RepID=UPI0035159199
MPDSLSEDPSLAPTRGATHRPDPASLQSPGQFVEALRAIKAVSGLSLRELQRHTGLPRSTIAHTLDAARTQLPPLARSIAILRACRVSEDHIPSWDEAWTRIQRTTIEEQGGQSPAPAQTLKDYESENTVTVPQEPDPTCMRPHASRSPRRYRVLSHLVALMAGAAIGAGTVLATYETTVTVADPAAGAPGYVARIASATGTAYTTSTKLPVRHAVAAGDTLVVPMMLTNTHTGTISATDSQGNTYTIAADQTDDAGDRTLILTATAVKALSTSDTITIGYPSTGEQHLAVDELTNVKAVDQHAAATGAAGTAFNSGSTPTTTANPEMVFGVAGVQGGTAATWSSGFTALPTLFVSHDQLATGYRTVTATGTYAAAGTCDHQWMATAVTFAPSAP